MAADQELVDNLAQLSFVVQAALAEVASEHGLSVIQVRLLGVLRDRTPGMRELAGHLGLDKSSMSGLVDRASKRGLVSRAPSPHDGRGVLVSLTEDGRALARAGEEEIGRRIAALAAHMDADQRAQLAALAGVFVSGGR